MKRHLVLEYRIRKLEKAILEDIDSDLDKMSDDILNRMPNDDLDTELDKKAKDIVGKQIKPHYRTISDWIDSMVFNNEVEAEDKLTGLKYAIMHLKGMLDDQTSAHLKEGGLDFGLHRAAEIKNSIEELRNTNVLIANQKMVSALRKKIKELESELKDIKNRNQLESLTYEGKQDQEILNDFLGDDYYNKYQTIKNRISDPEYKDIYKLIKKNPDEVKDYIDNFKSNRDSVKAAKEGATKLYEDSDWVVYRITSYNAAKYYGKNTKWCISGNYPGHEGLGEKYFNNYIKDYSLDGGYYFYINKHNPNDKYCVLKKQSGNIGSIWDAKDTNIGDSLYWDDVDLPYVKEIGLNTAEQEDLLFAIKDGDLEMVKQCVNDNTVNAVTPTGRTPLMIAAAKSGYTAIEIAAYLIDNGADVSYVSKDGNSALVIASESGNYEMVQLLVEYGHADVNNPMTEYGSAAYLATDDEDIEEYLISKGAKVN